MKILSNIPKNDENASLKKSSNIKEKVEKKTRNTHELQLDLGLKESPLNRLFEVKQKLDKLEDRLKMSYYWKNPMVWITLFFPFTLTLILTFYYESVQHQIPDRVPLVWLNQDLVNIFLPKIVLMIIPYGVVFASVIALMLLRISYRRLEKFVFLLMISSIAASILSYITVYRILRLFV